MLQAAGHEVKALYDGTSALEMAKTYRPNVAIVDVELPGMNGYEIARRMRELVPGVALIALSGWSGEAERGRAREAGFDRYLTEPVEAKDLGKLVGEV